MKILFSMRHSGAIRNFESTIRALAGHGHTIHLSFVLRDKIGDDRMAVGSESVVTRLMAECPQVTCEWMPKRSDSVWYWFARSVRFLADALRYRLPAFAAADRLRGRALERLPAPVRWSVRLPCFGWPWCNRFAAWCLATVDRALPIDPLIAEDLESHDPDLVLLTPLVDLGSDQVDYVKAARARGVPSALLVHSWDNLTNKGVIRFMPDRVFVWNEAQRREAIVHHGAAEAVAVATGAHTYDHWFDWQPSRTAEEFKREVGLDPSRPYILYLGSSRFIAPDEIDFVERWLTALQRAGQLLENTGVLIRPHPENPQAWERLDELGIANLTVWPRLGANPVVDELRTDYFDTMFHCVAVVGINTSGMIEAGIVGRPTFTVLDPANRGTQQGTLHFHLLLEVGDGLLRVADDFDAHGQQLRAYLSGAEDAAGRQFIIDFVRPRGLDVRATDVLVDEVEQLGAAGRFEPRREPAWLLIVRALAYPGAAFLRLQHGVARLRRKRQRGAGTSSAWRWILVAPRKAALRVLLSSLRQRNIRAFVNKYVVPRVVSGETLIPEAARTEREVRRVLGSGRPIVIGPWLGEVGFEVLYWIPFLNWVRSLPESPPGDRFTVISRGGTAQWYRTVTDNYVEVLDYMTDEEYVRRHMRGFHGGKQKQRKVSEYDNDVVRIAKDVGKLNDPEILHPGLMYDLFMRYWKRQASVRLADQFSTFLPHVTPTLPLAPGELPDEFVAMRFYFNDSFPDTRDNRRFVASLLRRLTAQTDVVLLNPGFAMDEHRDLEPSVNPRIHSLEHLMTPATNLALQTAVIAASRAFVGTYGGLSYLAPFYGVDALAIYSHPEGFHEHHLEFAYHVFRGLGEGKFIAVDTRDLSLLNLALGVEAAGIRASGA